MFAYTADLSPMLLAKQLKSLLQEHDLTVTQLSRGTKISAKTLYQWLHGSSPRNLNHIRVVADYFNVTVDYLLFNRKIPVIKSDQYIHEDIEAGVFEIILRKVKDGKSP